MSIFAKIRGAGASDAVMPDATADVMRAMLADRRRRMDARRALSDEVQDARRLYGAATTEHETIMGLRPGGDGTPRGVTRAQIAAAVALVEETRAELQRRSKIYNDATAVNSPAESALQRCERYLQQPDVAGRPLRQHPGSVKPKRKAGVTPLEAIRSARAEIDALKADLATVASRPLPSRDAKAAARRQIEELAASNTPDVTPLFAGEPAKLPITDIRQTRRGPRIAHDVPDATSLVAWTFADAIIEKLETAIDAAADDANALTAADKVAETKRLQSEILAAERVEEALIEAAHAEGQAVDRRADADPRAILWLAAEMPEVTR